MEKRIVLPENNRFGQGYLQFKVDYNKGGHNYWNGAEEARGIYLHCTPISVIHKKCSDGEYNLVKWNSKNPGWKHCFLTLGRKSQKAIDKVWNIAEPYFDKLADAYIKDDQREVFSLLQVIHSKL